MSAIQRRLIEAERTAHLQQSRNEKEGLLARVDMARAQQQALREKLGETIEKRRLIEPLFIELQSSQDVLEKGLAGLKADDLNDRLQALMQSTELHEVPLRRYRARAGDVRAAEGRSSTRSRPASLRSRTSRAASRAWSTRCTAFATSSPRPSSASTMTATATLAERATKLAESKQAFDERVSRPCSMQFAKLDGLNNDIRGLFGKLRGEVDAQLVSYKLTPK